MTPPRILVKTEASSRSVLLPAPETGWYLLGGIGFAFALVSGADLVLAWYPLAFGSREWEFATVTSVLDGLPLLAMGLILSFAAAVARGSQGLVKFWAVVLVVLAVVLFGCLALYSRTIPAALTAVTDPVLRLGLVKSITKTILQAVGYPVAFLWTGIVGWKHARSA